jgi:formate dehydrogenase subunit gamma
VVHQIPRIRPGLFLAVLATFLCLVLPPAGLADSSVRPPGNAVNLEATDGPSNALGGLSDSDFWRAVKAGDPDAAAEGIGEVPSSAPPPTPGDLLNGIIAEVTAPAAEREGRLMQVLGEDWRLFRREYILPYSGWVITGVLGLIVLFRLIRGKIMIRGGRAGTTIPRFSMSHRIAHWYLASSFSLMAISGLVILLGRPFLAPLIGKQANAVLTSAMLQGHNLFGPVFILALLIVIFRFMKGNFFQWADLKWIIKGGGLIAGHASSHHYPFGEKTWYWIVVIVGLIMAVTGLLLEFPWITDVIAWHQLSTILHALGAILLISIALGHIYVGSIGMEGSLDSMLKGEVDENWAKEHHDLWYEEVTGKSAKLEATGEAAE